LFIEPQHLPQQIKTKVIVEKPLYVQTNNNDTDSTCTCMTTKCLLLYLLEKQQHKNYTLTI